MKTGPLLLLASLTVGLRSAEPPAGAVSEPHTFAIDAAGTLGDRSLEDYRGSILVVMLMTPWCPICNSHTAAVGDGILDHFDDASRGALQGRNDHGVPVRSVVLSSEPSGYDAAMASIASNNGFEQWGLDADANREDPRVMLGYYRGGFIDSSNLYAWGEDRRRVVVLNLVEGARGHAYREILLNMNHYGSGDNAAAQAAINAVEPSLAFSAWRLERAFPAGLDGPDDDPDGDGSSNAWEFFHGTDPLDPASSDPGPSLTGGPEARTLVYRRAAGIGGFTLRHRVSPDLLNWSDLDDAGLQVADLGEFEQVMLELSGSGEARGFVRLEIEFPEP